MRSRNLILTTLMVLLLSGCATLTQTFTTLIPKAVEKNVLSGREGVNGPVLVVKIDDTNSAHPQIGLEDADVVYIEQVEGGLTRIAAVFSSVIPMRIGPVRSARISDIEIMSQYGRVAFAYSGAQKKLLPVIAAANLQNLGAQAQSPTIYTTDPARKQPFAMVLRADFLMQKIIDKAYVIDSARSVGWSFGDIKSVGVPIERVVLNWPAATYSAIWSASENRWHLTHNNEPNLTETGKTLGPTTFVIQMVSITPSSYSDKFGGNTPFSNTVGTGTGYILRDGRSYTATWSRPTADVGTSWTALDGSEITFAPGQVWVALIDTEPDFTLITASAKASTTK
jgi:hypothetical protein